MKKEIEEGLKPLFEIAEKEGLWFWCHYQDLWFSPSELKRKQAEGRFCWGAVNWKLRNPQEKIKELNCKIQRLKDEINVFKNRI